MHNLFVKPALQLVSDKISTNKSKWVFNFRTGNRRASRMSFLRLQLRYRYRRTCMN